MRGSWLGTMSARAGLLLIVATLAVAGSANGRIGPVLLSPHLAAALAECTPTVTSITSGPGGRMWFLEAGDGEVASIALDGTGVQEIPLPGGHTTNTAVIAAGPDGNLWVYDYVPRLIVRVNPGGGASQFNLPQPAAGSPGHFGGLVSAAGYLWIAEDTYGPNSAHVPVLWRLAVDGTAVEIDLTTASSDVGGVAAATDGTIWVTELRRTGTTTTSMLASYVPATGAYAEVADVAGAYLVGHVAAGPLNDLWYLYDDPSGIPAAAHRTSSGTVSRKGLAVGYGAFADVSVDGADRFWFASVSPAQLVRIDTATQLSTFTIAQEYNYNWPTAVEIGPDGNAWWGTDLAVGRMDTTGAGATSFLLDGHVPPQACQNDPAYAPRQGGTTVTLYGRGFDHAATLKVGSQAVSFTVLSPSKLRFVASPGPAGYYEPITVLDASGMGDTQTALLYEAPPVVNKMCPNNGPQSGGTLVRIYASDLDSATRVRFGSRDAQVVQYIPDWVNPGGQVVPGYLEVRSPPGQSLGGVDVAVTNIAGTSGKAKAARFTYTKLVSVDNCATVVGTVLSLLTGQ